MRQTVLYPLAKQIDYSELKFSLRSIEKYLTPPFEVVIVGDTMPEWINHVTQIELGDVKGQPNYSVRRKVLAGLQYAEEFLLMNDDFYLLQANDFRQPYSSGTLKGKGESGMNSILKKFNSKGEDLKYFGHYPAIIHKDFFQLAISEFSNDVPIKSAFFNWCGQNIDIIEIPDCKVMTPKKPEEIRAFIKDKPCFSSGVHSLKSCLPILEELFPEPSKYEI